nr:CAunnamed protein product [Biomphalaria glabrata]
MISTENLVITFCLTTLCIVLVQSQIGPPYPVTAAWFRDRFSSDEWSSSLETFKKQGGDTIFLRAPPIIQRTRQDMMGDLNFIWCGSYKQSNPAWGERCYDEAIQDLNDMNLVVSAIVTYQYEENFSDDIMLCPKYDKKIISSRIYYRIVLPGKYTEYNSSAPCDYKPGSNVVVLFTSFAGTDPHELLLQEAYKQGLNVYFGLPGIPNNFDSEIMPAYYVWVERILQEHHSRYSNMKATAELSKTTNYHSLHDKPTLYDALEGYYGTDECCLAQITAASPYVTLYTKIGGWVKGHEKKFAISPYIDLNRSQLNGTVTDHVTGFVAIAQTRSVDIIAVQEGRGAAKGCYYWPKEINDPVFLRDPVLDKAIHYLNPTLKPNVTFAEAFSASNREIFAAFQKAQQGLANTGVKFDFWLNAEAFEYLRDDPCLPVDVMASGMGELLDRTSKERLDTALSVAGAKVQKIISFAWDSDYICKTRQIKTNLNEEIMQDLQRPIIANCSFNSYQNLSVVILGFNLDAETQAFTVQWTDTRGRNRTNNIHGYLFELDYGERHNLVSSLQYVMLWNIQEMVLSLAPKGTIEVSADSARQSCYFDYDLPY